MNKLSRILREEGLLSKSAGVSGPTLLEDEVNFGRPIRVEGFDYNSAHYRVDRKDGLYLELYSDDLDQRGRSSEGGPTLYGNVRYNAYEGGNLSMREVAEEIREDLEDGKMPVMFKRQHWST